MRYERGGMEGREVGEIGERTEKDTEREKDGCVVLVSTKYSGLELWPGETQPGSLGDNQGESQAMSFLCPSPV